MILFALIFFCSNALGMNENIQTIKQYIEQENYRSTYLQLNRITNTVTEDALDDLITYAHELYTPKNSATYRKQAWCGLFLTGLTGICYAGGSIESSINTNEQNNLRESSIISGAVTAGFSLGCVIFNATNNRSKILSALCNAKNNRPRPQIAHV